MTRSFFLPSAVLAVLVALSAIAAAEQPAAEAPAVECTDAKCPGCEAGTCTDSKCPAKACEKEECEESQATPDVAVAQFTSAAIGEAKLATPTHRQSKIIKANQEGLDKTKLNCFTMTRDGRILAGCGSSKENGEIRVFDSNGEYVESWSTPCKVEAVNVRASDGMVFVAGNGILAKLDDTGNLVAENQSPHATVSDEQAEKMREAVVKQMTERVDMYRRQAEIYDKQIDLIAGQIESLEGKLDEFDDDAHDDAHDEDDGHHHDEDDDSDGHHDDDDADHADDEDDGDEEDAAIARRKSMIERQIKQLTRSMTSLERTQKLWSERIEQLGDAEPSEEDIQKQLEAQVSRKMAVASISAVDDTVYLACSEAVGYGYCVWAIDDDLEEGEEIVGDLRGCCGQMDVQANANGVYVAENARDRVVCYDHEGEEITHWGHSAREGVRGFGSCCNPMNVAFGPNSTVYTAESGTGRIKQYTHDGELLQVVGAADLVPGCKKVSIGVSSDGSRVFMLDITRDHIVMMDAIPTEEREQMVADAMQKSQPETTEEATEEAEQPAAEAQASAPSTTRALLRVFTSPFRSE